MRWEAERSHRACQKFVHNKFWVYKNKHENCRKQYFDLFIRKKWLKSLNSLTMKRNNPLIRSPFRFPLQGLNRLILTKDDDVLDLTITNSWRDIPHEFSTWRIILLSVDALTKNDISLDVLVVLPGRYDVWDLWLDREPERKLV